jgi:hypothetical protein
VHGRCSLNVLMRRRNGSTADATWARSPPTRRDCRFASVELPSEVLKPAKNAHFVLLSRHVREASFVNAMMYIPRADHIPLGFSFGWSGHFRNLAGGLLRLGRAPRRHCLMRFRIEGIILNDED